MKLDILAIAVHPDDVELGCAGVLLAEKGRGKKTGVVDLTRGELGTRGSAELRHVEATAAARLMQLDVRENAGMADGFFKNDEEHQKQLIRYIRKYRPEIIIANALDDRHPDHGRAGDLANDACFLAGLAKIETQEGGVLQEAWRPRLVLQYIQDHYIRPDIIVDITPYIETKIQSIKAFKTQFYNPDHHEAETYISSPEFFESVLGRAREFGKSIGATFGEGFTSRKLLGVEDIFQLR